jgi:hypothetical protein
MGPERVRCQRTPPLRLTGTSVENVHLLALPVAMPTQHLVTGMPTQHLVTGSRFYASPCPHSQPGIFAIRSVLHAHANRRGVFAYGNALSACSHVDALLFSKLASLNSPHFDFAACNFSERNMSSRERDGTSKDGTGRVAMHRMTGLPHLYTIEANFFGAQHVPDVAAAWGDRARDASPVHRVRATTCFDESAFHQVTIPSTRFARLRWFCHVTALSASLRDLGAWPTPSAGTVCRAQLFQVKLRCSNNTICLLSGLICGYRWVGLCW